MDFGHGGVDPNPVNRLNIPVKLTRVTVGKANPPDSVENQRIATAQQEPLIQTEMQPKLAQDARKAAEQSRADADNAYRQSIGLSPEQFLQLQSINMQKEVCEQGAKCSFIMNSAKALPMLDVQR